MSLEIRLQHAIADRRLMAYQPGEILSAVNQILLQTYVLLGFAPPKDNDLGILIAKLSADLQESYPGLTLQEVALCFELGAKGEYGDFMGLNLRTFTRWLKSYQTSELRYRAVVQRERLAQAALPPVSEAYKEEHERTYLLRVFAQYRAGYPLDRLYPARVYRSLQERGIIRNTAEEKWEAVRQAAGYRPAGNMIVGENVRQILIKQQAMAILLKRFFDRLIRDEKDLFGKTAA
ncbi:hypothetical protein [uncultured Parabacteroides sp.]|uniref:hypothetical protein n=1 Tax=uncultured Parabacteroides sp. TaxID=512312 RepID=UPI0025882622|nr:hypothetical protein [uncultured Parabacteroides sp.]